MFIKECLPGGWIEGGLKLRLHVIENMSMPVEQMENERGDGIDGVEQMEIKESSKISSAMPPFNCVCVCPCKCVFVHVV